MSDADVLRLARKLAAGKAGRRLPFDEAVSEAWLALRSGPEGEGWWNGYCRAQKRLTRVAQLERQACRRVRGRLAGVEATRPRGSQPADLAQLAAKVLPPRYWQVIEAVYWQGRTLRDIAPELGVSAQRIDEIHKAALERLRRYLKEDEDGELA